VTHVNSELFQRGSMITEENVNQANLSALADWMLSDQVMVLQYFYVIYFLYTFHMTLFFTTLGPINTKWYVNIIGR
jgi:hypothetical protein